MQESLCQLELFKEGKSYYAKLYIQDTEKEFQHNNLEAILSLIVTDIEEELERL